MRAWMQIGGSSNDYINDKISLAASLNAPSTCIHVDLDNDGKATGYTTLEDCPKITIWRHAKLDKRLAEMLGRKPKTHEELIEYLISIGNHWAMIEEMRNKEATSWFFLMDLFFLPFFNGA